MTSSSLHRTVLLLSALIVGCQEAPDRPSRTLPPAVLRLAPLTLNQNPVTTATTQQAVLMSLRAQREALPARATPRNGGTMPDPVQTPGAVFPDANESMVCQSGYTASVRDVPAAVKKQVFANYGIDYAMHSHYEVDHLVPLEIGGSNDITNLWPEPYDGPWNAHMKDRLENKLHEMMCQGKITIQEAQQEIAADWIAAYQKYVGS